MNTTTVQADVLQRLAWDAVQNYPDSGLCEEIHRLQERHGR
jgi:hypothetical protein